MGQALPAGGPGRHRTPHRVAGGALRAVGRRGARLRRDRVLRRTTTYAELGDQIARAAEGLRRLGVQAGDRVALVLPNCPQHVVAFYAVLRLGAVVVEHNPLYTERELRHLFEDHSARVAICWDAAVQAPGHAGRRRRRARRLGQPAEGVPDAQAARTAAADREAPRHPRPAHPAGPRDDAVGDPARGRAPGRVPPEAGGARPGGHPVHVRHHRRAEGRDAQPLQPVQQRPPGRGLDARRAVPQGGLLRDPADVPRVRHDPVPHLRRAEAGTAGAVPRVRRRPGAGGGEEVTADRLLRGPADLRAHGDRGEGARHQPALGEVLHLRRDEPARLDRRVVGERLRRAAGRGLRHDGGLAGLPRQPVRTQPEDRDDRRPVPQHADEGGRHRRPDPRGGPGRTRGAAHQGPAGVQRLLEQPGGDGEGTAARTAGCAPATS